MANYGMRWTRTTCISKVYLFFLICHKVSKPHSLAADFLFFFFLVKGDFLLLQLVNNMLLGDVVA